MNWIPVSERLPAIDESGESEIVLCYEMDVASPFVGWYDKGLGGWIVYHYRATDKVITKVTHWMPLPEPPNKKEESDG